MKKRFVYRVIHNQTPEIIEEIDDYLCMYV